MIRTRLFYTWNIKPRRNLNDWEVEEMGRLLQTLGSYILGDIEQRDVMLWCIDEENGFFVKSIYHALCPPGRPFFLRKCVWNSLIQLKVSFFMWELWWDRAPTVDNLIRQGMIMSNRCCLCCSDAESSGHLFLHCPWVVPLWSYFIGRFSVVWMQSCSLKDLLSSWQFQSIRAESVQSRELWMLILAAVCWLVWEERNRRTFEDQSRLSRIIIDTILSILYEWLFAGTNRDRPPFRSWIFDCDSLIL